MTPLILDILIVAVIALFAFLGWRKGMILSLCGLLAIFVAYAGATFISRTFSKDVANILQPAIQTRIEDLLDDALPPASAVPPASSLLPDGSSAQDDLLENATIRQALDALENSELFSGLQKNLEDAVRQGLVPVMSTAAASIASYLALQASQLILFYLSFLLIMIIWWLLSHALDLACRLPVLRTFNELGGLLIGILKGALILFAAVWFLSLAGIISEQTIQQTYLFRLYMNFQLM